MTLEKSDVVILAVKPKIIPFVLDDLYPYVDKKHLIITFAAGVNILSIEKVFIKVLLCSACTINILHKSYMEIIV